MSTSWGPTTIIADDLTGACDAAVPFASAGKVVRVQLGDGLPVVGAAVRAISTNTRDVPRSGAEERIRELAEEQVDGEVFKKVDSVFRGNTVVEICAAVQHWRFDFAVLAPAYPGLGRTIRDGVLRIEDAGGKGMVRVEELLVAAGLCVKQIAVGREEELVTAMFDALTGGKKVVLCDSVVQEDLELVVRAARSLQKRVMWIGSGGLAHALAGKAQSQPEMGQWKRGQVVYFVGSEHPVTSAQVEVLRSAGATESANGSVVKIAMGQTTEDEVRRAVTGLSAEQIGCMLMTGGDTALFVCRALGVESIRLEREFAPGVPLGTVEGGRWDGVAVALKSGGFGEPGLMLRLLKEFGAKREVTV